MFETIESVDGFITLENAICPKKKVTLRLSQIVEIDEEDETTVKVWLKNGLGVCIKATHEEVMDLIKRGYGTRAKEIDIDKE